MSKSLEERFFEKVDASGPCWEWTGARMKNGYGVINLGSGRGTALAHRVGYELLVGSVPTGAQLDHVCRVRHCVDPDHLEPVVQRENLRRGYGFVGRNARKVTCKEGHSLDTPYVSPQGRRERRCSTCAKPMTGHGQGDHTDSEARAGAKLTWVAVRQIRAAYLDGDCIADLARHHGISPRRVRQVINHEGWRES